MVFRFWYVYAKSGAKIHKIYEICKSCPIFFLSLNTSGSAAYTKLINSQLHSTLNTQLSTTGLRPIYSVAIYHLQAKPPLEPLEQLAPRAPRTPRTPRQKTTYSEKAMTFLDYVPKK